MYNQLIEIDKDGNAFMQDHTIALMPKLWAVYKHKRMGSKMVRYIISMYDYKSPYRRLPQEARNKEVTYNVFGSHSNSFIDNDIVKEAILEYDRLQFDPDIDQYNAMVEMAGKVTIAFNAMKPTVANVSDINKMSKEMFSAAEAREKMKKLILKGQEDEVKIHGSTLNDLSLIEETHNRQSE